MISPERQQMRRIDQSSFDSRRVGHQRFVTELGFKLPKKVQRAKRRAENERLRLAQREAVALNQVLYALDTGYYNPFTITRNLDLLVQSGFAVEATSQPVTPVGKPDAS